MSPDHAHTRTQFDAVAQHMPVAVIRTDARANCVYANERWYRLTGMSREDAAAQGWVRALHPEDRERVVRKIRECTAVSGEYAQEFRLRSADGAVRLVSSRVVPLLDSAGRVESVLAAVTDLTERYTTEGALRTLAGELRNRVKELNCLVGVSHIIERCDHLIPQVLEQTASLLAESWDHADVACARIVLRDAEYRTPNYRDTPWRQSSPIHVAGEPAGLVEVAYLEERPVRDEGPFLHEERSVLDAVAERLGGTAERIESTRMLREHEQDIRARLAHLARVNVMGEMATSIAHEVSQPLTAIAAYAQACRRIVETRGANTAELSRHLGRIAEEAARAGDIIHRVVELSRKRKGRRVQCDMNALIRDIFPLAEADARVNDTELVFDLSDGLPPLYGDGIQLQQVVLNLMRNAIDATDDDSLPHRRVRVATAQADGYVTVSVEDNGRGLPEDAEEHLFEPFFTTKETGIGMGLSISRKIVGEHGGRMWFSRHEDRGATFYFTIPTGLEDGDAPA